MASPRVLTVTFELHVPRGLGTNIRGKRLDDAVARLTTAVQTVVANAFPWADRLVVHYDWSYRWSEDVEEITLPATEANTVETLPTPEEEAALVAAEWLGSEAI